MSRPRAGLDEFAAVDCLRLLDQNFNMEYFLKETQKIMRKTIQETGQSELLDLCRTHFKSQGKFNRPKAAALLGQALQTPPEYILGWAAALEMFHNGSLIHDDLQDGDVCRRGAPTLWRKSGKNRAMNAGTFLMLNAFQCLSSRCLGASTDAKLSPDLVLELQSLLTASASEALEGQCREERLNRLSALRGLRELYFNVAELKCSSLYGAMARGVALISGLSPGETGQLEGAYKGLGTLFQIQDDIIDLYGDKQRDMQGNDLKEGKVSFLILKHLELHHYNHDSMKSLLSKGRGKLQRGEILIVKEQFASDGTLAASIEEFSSLCAQLIEGEYLAQRPRIKAAMAVLLEDAMKPLLHLTSVEKFPNQALSKVSVRQTVGR